MVRKTISLDDDAYELLRSEKRPDESFSDVVKRLVDERSWSEVAGSWEHDAEDLRGAIEEGRERSRRRRDRQADRLDDI